MNRSRWTRENPRIRAGQPKNGMGWKELKAGLCKIMQDYCGESKSEETLRMGLRWSRA